MKKAPEDASTSDQGDLLAEMKDCEERKLNIIINGVKESAATEKAQVQEEENTFLDELLGSMDEGWRNIRQRRCF